MNTPDREWWIAQSGEYVLGTLDYADWVTFRKTIEHDKDAQRLVAEWENAFQPLADSLTPLEPGSDVWDAINTRLFGTPHADSTGFSTAKLRPNTQSLEKRLDRWRSFAGLATAASLLLASLAWVNHLGVEQKSSAEPVVSVEQFNAIAIVQDAEAAPLWVVDAAFEAGFVRVTAVAPPGIDEAQSYELWMVKPENEGVQSIGVIPKDADESILLEVSVIDDEPVAFAVSLEPLGGSLLNVPSGPVLYQGSYQSLR